MDLKTMRYYVTVVEEKNITRAARALCMAQPPLSAQMKKLEEELQTQLFIRGHREVELTEAGKFLYLKAKDLLALNDKTMEDIALMNKGISGTISIGFAGDFAKFCGVNWISDFKKRRPGAHFRVHAGPSDVLIDKLRSGIISLALIVSPYDQGSYNGLVIENRELVACIPASSDMAALTEISLRMLVKEELIVPVRRVEVDGLRREFRKLHLEPRIAAEVEDEEMAMELVKRGTGIAVLPRPKLEKAEGLAFVRLEGSENENQYCFIWQKGRPLPAIEEDFIDFVKGTLVQ